MVRLIITFLVLLVATTAQAQTVLTNPTKIEFPASADQTTIFDDANVLTGYRLDVKNSADVVVFSKPLDKPTPDTTGLITVPVAEFATLPKNVVYTAVIVAFGPGGSNAYSPSNPFAFPGPPRASGTPVVKK